MPGEGDAEPQIEKKVAECFKTTIYLLMNIFCTTQKPTFLFMHSLKQSLCPTQFMFPIFFVHGIKLEIGI